ncbi:MAG: hypothetical protein IKN57_04670 [Parasporobacterium sp.]|nr:hypothetical protein [Parasporobacterium sp.]
MEEKQAASTPDGSHRKKSPRHSCHGLFLRSKTAVRQPFLHGLTYGGRRTLTDLAANILAAGPVRQTISPCPIVKIRLRIAIDPARA